MRSGSGAVSTSIDIPLICSMLRIVEFRNSNLSFNEFNSVLKMTLSDSINMFCCVSRWTCKRSCSFWLFSSDTWFVRSSSCCCFFILDLFADSRFDSIRFRFFSSPTSCGSPSVNMVFWRICEIIYMQAEYKLDNSVLL